jgi:hypothetical protein
MLLARGTRLRVVLPLVHIAIMCLVAIWWIRATIEYGDPVGPDFNTAYRWTKVVDFPVASVCDSASRFLVTQVRFRIFDSILLATAVAYWALLVVFGTAQWYLIGWSVSKLVERRRPILPNARSG